MFCVVEKSFYVTDSLQVGKGRPPTCDLYYTQDNDIYTRLQQEGNKVIFLTEKLKVLSNSVNLFDLYSHIFCNVCSDEGMAIELIKGFLLPNDSTTYCMIHNNTFCWFRLRNGVVDILGSNVFEGATSMFSCGAYLKFLRHEIILSGGSLSNLVFISWGSLPDVWAKHIKFTSIIDVFNKVKGLKGLSFKELVIKLSKRRYLTFNETALTFVSALQSSSKLLGLIDSNGICVTKSSYFKDYSICTSTDIADKPCSYGIVLDCEGVKGSDGSLRNGAGEVGGIIFSEYNGIMINLYTFVSSIELMEDTFIRVVDAYKVITGSSLPRNGIPVYVFGHSDKIMLKYTVDKFTKKGKKFVESRFSVHDCIPIINGCKELQSYSGKKSLRNIATQFKVCCVSPSHNALADARTLFNILAHVKKGDTYE